MSIADNIHAGQGAGARERAHRSNLFLSASFETAGTWNPVRIRNLSETGALLEGASLPAVGASLILKRQEVEIEARVAWLSPPRCGVAFQEAIKVGEWVSGKRGTADFEPAGVEERRVAGRRAEDRDPSPAPAAHGADVDARLAEELAYVRRMLELLSDRLADEPVFVQRHADKLQQFDLAGQILGHLAAVLQAEDREAAIQAIGMEELRARLMRKALFDRR
jgi:hypothetical protein